MGKVLTVVGIGVVVAIGIIGYRIAEGWKDEYTDRLVWAIVVALVGGVVLVISHLFAKVEGRRSSGGSVPAGWGGGHSQADSYAMNTPNAFQAPMVISTGGGRRSGGATQVYFPGGFPGQGVPAQQYGQQGWQPPVQTWQPPYQQEVRGFNDGGGFGGGFPGFAPQPPQQDDGFKDLTGGNVF